MYTKNVTSEPRTPFAQVCPHGKASSWFMRRGLIPPVASWMSSVICCAYIWADCIIFSSLGKGLLSLNTYILEGDGNIFQQKQTLEAWYLANVSMVFCILPTHHICVLHVHCNKQLYNALSWYSYLNHRLLPVFSPFKKKIKIKAHSFQPSCSRAKEPISKL